MKKSIWLVFLSIVLTVVGCKYDDSYLQGKVEDLDNRVSALEQTVATLNSNVSSIQSAITALQADLKVTSVVVTRDENGAPVKYDITFSDGQTISIVPQGEKGDKGENGTPGEPGQDGSTPVIGVELIDGVYYWTVNGELLKDTDGNPIPVTGENGKDGVTPQFKIEDGHWLISYDDGQTWDSIDGAGSGTTVVVNEYDEYVELVINGVSVNIPKEKPFTLEITVDENSVLDSASFAYTISGVSEGEETEVDILSITGKWDAEVVAADNVSGVINVTNVGGGDAKIFVYATNHKGKTDIVGLKLVDGSVVTVVADVEGVEAEGGFIAFKVEYNVDYEIVIPAEAKTWISVAPATRALETKEYVLEIKENTSSESRSAAVAVVNGRTGETVSEIEVFQYAAGTSVADLAAAIEENDGTAVAVKGLTVLAASAESAIVTDGKTFSYIAAAGQKSGEVIEVYGTKQTDVYGQPYIVAENTVTLSGEPQEVGNHDYFLYYGLAANDISLDLYGSNHFYTATSGRLSLEDGVYFVPGFGYEDNGQRIVIENPVQDLSALVGKFVSVSGWVKAVDTDYFLEHEEYITIATDVTEITFAEEPGWEPYYAGMTSGESGYPEAVGVNVSNPTEGSYYQVGLYSADELEEFDSVEEMVEYITYNMADDLQFNISYYTYVYGYPYDFVFDVFAHDDTYEEAFTELDYGKYVIIAVGLDADARVSGKYAIKEFEKEDPHVKAAYEDFLGDWTISGYPVSITEKEKGVSYGIKLPLSEVFGVAEGLYDAENGKLVVWEQQTGTGTSASYGPYTCNLSGLYYYSATYPTEVNYPVDAEEPAILFTAGKLDDGTFDLTPGTYENLYKSGTFVGFKNAAILTSGSYAGYQLNFNGQPEIFELPSMLVPGAKGIRLNYEDYLGTWSVNGVEWVISEKEKGVSYNIDNMPASNALAARGGNVTVEAQYDAENGQLYVVEQFLAAYQDPSGNGYGLLHDYLSGVFMSGSSTYPYYPINGDDASTIFTFVGLDDGTYELRPGSCNYGTFIAFRFRWQIMEGVNAGMGNTYGETSLPISNVSKVVKIGASYEDFLGTWTVGTDTWTIKEKTAGSTYSISGVYGSASLYGGVTDIEASFDTDHLVIKEQILGAFNSNDLPSFANNPYGMCMDVLSAYFPYSTSGYWSYPWNMNTFSVIANGYFDESGNVQLTPGANSYNTFSKFGFLWIITEPGEDEGDGNVYGYSSSNPTGYTTTLPNTMVKTAGGSSAKKASATAPKTAVKANRSAAQLTDGKTVAKSAQKFESKQTLAAKKKVAVEKKAAPAKVDRRTLKGQVSAKISL